MEGGADGGERAAELVGQHRQELVLAAVGLAQLVVQAGVLDGDGRAPGQVLGQRRSAGPYRRPDSAATNVTTPSVSPRAASGTQCMIPERADSLP